jgi:hypothetical protein
LIAGMIADVAMRRSRCGFQDLVGHVEADALHVGDPHHQSLVSLARRVDHFGSGNNRVGNDLVSRRYLTARETVRCRMP